MESWLIIIGVFAVFGAIGWFVNLIDESNNNKTENDRLKDQNYKLQEKNSYWENRSNALAKNEEKLQSDKKLFETLFEERTKNYPVVANIWTDLQDLADTEAEKYLHYKKRPAHNAAQVVSEIKKEKRELIKELVSWKYKAQNYEAIYPWLEEELSADIDNEIQANIYYTVYSAEEREDPVTLYVAPEDYRKLSITERNQLALDRYWQHGKKTKWMIGKIYERYVGYLYETEGWKVQYFGIHKRYEDLGRDIIATKGSEMHVVQCKNWSKFKSIYENHIFQLFGTSYSMKKEYSSKNIVPVFFTSTVLSDVAREFAKLLGMKVFENKKVEQYPCIKCNVAANGEKIYHLPFDQQYDNVLIEPHKGEFYANTVKEAESKGFRRAFRWHAGI